MENGEGKEKETHGDLVLRLALKTHRAQDRALHRRRVDLLRESLGEVESGNSGKKVDDGVPVDLAVDGIGLKTLEVEGGEKLANFAGDESCAGRE
jgi:hypothetical protein